MKFIFLYKNSIKLDIFPKILSNFEKSDIFRIQKLKVILPKNLHISLFGCNFVV